MTIASRILPGEPNEDSNPYPGWSLSLPFSWEEPQSGGHYLSTRVYDGVTSLRCSGTLYRSTYVLYEHDQLPPLAFQPPGGGPILEPYHDTNRRVKSTREVGELLNDFEIGTAGRTAIRRPVVVGGGSYGRGRVQARLAR